MARIEKTVKIDAPIEAVYEYAATVATIPELYVDYGAHGFENSLPRVLITTRFLGIEAWQWLALIGAVLVAWAGGFLLGTLVMGLARRIAEKTQTDWDDELVAACPRTVHGVPDAMLRS